MFFTVRHWLFLLFLVLGQSQVSFGNNEGQDEASSSIQSYIAVSSLRFHPGTDYNVFFTVNPSQNDEPLLLKCVLVAHPSYNTTIQSESISVRPGNSGHISIPMPEGQTIWRLFAWSVTEGSQENGYIDDAPHTLIHSSELPNADHQALTKADLAFILIQTDKPAYKPEDLVRIRVVTMGTNDLPHLTSGVNMTITDSKGTVMKKWEQPLELPESASQPSNISSNGNVALFGEFQKKKNGLSAYEYQLSSEPILGNWTIQVEAGNLKERMYFDVKRYILPKFQVKIEAPSVLYGRKDVSAAATIKVSYTYGKNLHGNGTVSVHSSAYGLTKTQQFVVKDGEAIVQLTLRSTSSPTVHTITANVTEKNTGRWQIGKATIRVYPQETYSVQWINEPLSYKPGLPFTVQLKITGGDGLPVKDLRPNALGITFLSPLNLPVQQTSIPLSGVANFTFLTPLNALPVNSGKFQVEYKKTKYNFKLPIATTGTTSGILIEIIAPPQTTNFIQGNYYNFAIRSNKPIQPDVIHYLFWDDAVMDVYGAQSIVPNNSTEAAKEFPFLLQMPKADYTELKIFVYFETLHEGSTQIISTSKSINAHNYLKIRASLPISKETPAPVTVIPPGNTVTLEPTPEAPNATIPEDAIYDSEEFQSDDPGVAEEQESQISSKLEAEPGTAVEIHFETYPNSTIAIRGIDQSLLLLTEEDNDLNQEAVENKRAALKPPPKLELNIIPPDNSTFLNAFQKLGISVLDSEKYVSFGSLAKTTVGGDSLEEGNLGVDANDLEDAESIPKVDIRLRTNFPETWLWEEFESSSNSSTTTLSKILPDTLTSWIISGFSLNPKNGLGVASPATITGFMPFFVTLNLPYSVVNYETLDLQVIVHNYLNRDVNVSVTLLKHSDFEFADGRDNMNGYKTRSIKVQRNHAALTHFVITPMKIGQIPIEVKVVTEDGTAGDRMLRNLKVKPDGVRDTRTQFVIFDPEILDSNRNRTARLDVKFPEKMVKGANSLQLTVVGEFMGSVMSTLNSSSITSKLNSSAISTSDSNSTSSSSSSSNSTSRSQLGDLLQSPGGCGYQNMYKFIPNIIALNYLSSTSSNANNANDIIQKAKRNLENGYSYELQFRKSDGGFAMYADRETSVWITSLVLSGFVPAQKYITIDPRVIKGATNFLRSRQNSDGSFTDGRTYHPEMNSVANTADVLLTFIKANKRLNDPNLRVAIANGMKFISRKAVYDLDNNYITNLVTATLMAGNHPEKDRFLEKMEKNAKTATNSQGGQVKYWDMKNARENASAPLSIEMTSYALFAHVWNQAGTDGSAVKINNWLLTQRNPNGGFYSTVDTSVGLTALAEFSSSYSNSRSLMWKPTGSGEQIMMAFVPNILFLHYLTVTDSNTRDLMNYAKTNLEKGYAEQLQYRKYDGSFSAWTYTLDSFAEWKQKVGSTWLTAYVLQWFLVAQQYITVDPNVISGAINFIRSNQQGDGSFIERGQFYHPEMRGRTGSGVAFTAFITLALIKADKVSNNNDLNLKRTIQNGMRYISRQSYHLDDNYITNLVTATLMEGGHPDKTQFFKKMETAAQTTTDAQGVQVKYWDMLSPTEVATTSTAVEMTSYALLAHIWRNDTTDSSTIRINNWLVTQRNSKGGFYSAVDTEVGLTALAEFALQPKARFGDELELTIKALANSTSIKDTEFAVPILRWNRLVLQEFDLPVDTEKVSVQAQGSGAALVQLTETWYVPVVNVFPRDANDQFNITADMTIPDPEEEPTETELRVCVSTLHESGARDSIASIQLPSGYVFYPIDYEKDSEFMQNRPENVDRFEVAEENTKLVVYFHEIKQSPAVCLSLAALQQVEVANAKNSTILMYEYLDPTKQARAAYEPAHKITRRQLCQSTGACDS